MIYLTDQMDAYQPSMMIDRLEGRPLELDSKCQKRLCYTSYWRSGSPE